VPLKFRLGTKRILSTPRTSTAADSDGVPSSRQITPSVENCQVPSPVVPTTATPGEGRPSASVTVPTGKMVATGTPGEPRLSSRRAGNVGEPGVSTGAFFPAISAVSIARLKGVPLAAIRPPGMPVVSSQARYDTLAPPLKPGCGTYRSRSVLRNSSAAALET